MSGGSWCPGKISSANAEAWDLLASAYETKGEIDKAINCHLRTLKIEPRNPFTLKDLTELYYMKKDDDSALYYGLQILEKHPNNSPILKILCDIYIKRGNYNEALQIFKNALETNYPSCSEWLCLGKVYFEMKQYSLALKSFYNALQYRDYDDEHDEVWDCIEKIYQAMGFKDISFQDNCTRNLYVDFLESIREGS